VELGPQEAGAGLVPQDVDGLFGEVGKLLGLIGAWEGRRANRGPEDYSGWLVAHVFELWGALQVTGLTFATKCPDQVTKLLRDFKDIVEELVHYLYHGEPERQKEVVMHADGVLFKIQLSVFTFAWACARATPEDLQELNSEGGGGGGE
jgi:hypothetical protein